jgi:hypothetical protein
MRRASPYAAKKLKKAFSFQFSEPVTGYLTSACITACCCVGFTHRHVKADPDSGRFGDGRLIRTSDIIRIEREGAFWILRTLSGSFYVVVSFHSSGEYQSLLAFQKILPRCVHQLPARLH